MTNASGATITDATHIANVNPIRYRGYFYDSETKLYYCNSRYYDPQIKRFINADELLSTGTGFLGYNMFAYCNNNPVLFTDSEGLRPIIGDSVSHETAEEREMSCQYMKEQTKHEVVPSSEVVEDAYGVGNNYSDEVIELAALVYSEQAANNIITKEACADTVRNRIGVQENWVDYHSVISDPGQFDGYANPMYYDAIYYYYGTAANLDPISAKAANDALYVSIKVYYGAKDITNGAIVFCSPACVTPDSWFASLEQVIVSGANDNVWFGRIKQ